MSDREAIQVHHDGLCAWMRDNTNNIQTPEFRRRSDLHALVTALLDEWPGSPEQRAEVARRLNAGEG